MFRAKLLFLMMIISFAACSNKAVYENIRTNQKQECLKKPPSTYEECMARADVSYDEYQRQRDELEK